MRRRNHGARVRLELKRQPGNPRRRDDTRIDHIRARRVNSRDESRSEHPAGHTRIGTDDKGRLMMRFFR